MNDYNIEFAHIYADQTFGKEQIKSVKLLKNIIKKLVNEGKSFSTVILIDEFSPENNTLNEVEFLDKIRKNNVSIDFLAHESGLSEKLTKLLNGIDKKKLQTEGNTIFISDKGKRIGLRIKGRVTCSALMAIWTLSRLGIESLSNKTIKPLTNKKFQGRKLITILPKKYRETENKVLTILKNTKHRGITNKLEYVFF